MKKIVLILLTIAVLAILSSYIFVPSKIKISAVATGHTSTDAAYRFLSDESNWEKWWPGSEPFSANGINFRLNKKMFDIFELDLTDKNDTIKSYLQLLPGDKDLTGYNWFCEMNAGNNPINKWQRYFKATRIKKTFDHLLNSLKEKLEQEKILYGFTVKRVKVVDSVLLTIHSQFDHYPDEKEIDTMIRKLRKYITDLNGVEKNYPMLNVNPVGKNDYEAMVAIPTKWALPPSGSIGPKLVLKGGNLLETEIKGGPWAIRKAFEQFQNYRADFQILSPAIPYQQIITDRVKEMDTTKWITRLYYPVY